MGKLKEINGYVQLTLDKLPAIRADLVRLDDDWQQWEFRQFVEALRKWSERNPFTTQPTEQANATAASPITLQLGVLEATIRLNQNSHIL